MDVHYDTGRLHGRKKIDYTGSDEGRFVLVQVMG